MVKIEVIKRPSHDSDYHTPYCLALNGQVIQGSWVTGRKGKKSAGVDDAVAAALLIQCQFAEIANHFEYLRIRVPESPIKNFGTVWITCCENHKYYSDDAAPFNLGFSFDAKVEYWANLWSVADFALTLKKVVEDRGVPGLKYSGFGNRLFMNDIQSIGDFTLTVSLRAREKTVQQIMQHWSPIIKNICEKTELLLAAKTQKEALVALFRFAPEVKTACEQYLLYFAQFLQDLGIQATVDLQEQAREVLFTVTPTSGPEALGRIREALDVYLEMPRSPDFDAEVTRHTNIAVQQYAANVLHLRSQLVLAQAVLETKNATIEALQAANFQYRQLLNDNPQSQGQLPDPRTDNPQQDETILGGTVTITKANWKGLQVNFPHILRELRRRWNRED